MEDLFFFNPNLPTGKIYIHSPLQCLGWEIRLSGLVNVQPLMSAKHLLSTRCQQHVGWPHPCPSRWLSRHILTRKLKFPVSHHTFSVNSYNSMLTFNRSHLQPAKCNKHFIRLFYSPNTKLEKNMEGYQENSHFKKITFSYSVYKNLKVINIMNALTMQEN